MDIASKNVCNFIGKTLFHLISNCSFDICYSYFVILFNYNQDSNVPHCEVFQSVKFALKYLKCFSLTDARQRSDISLSSIRLNMLKKQGSRQGETV